MANRGALDAELNSALLDMLWDRDEATFDVFLVALSVVGFGDVAKVARSWSH